MKSISHIHNFFRSEQSLLIGLIFLTNSFLFGNWVTRIPDIKSTIGLDDKMLGFALLGAPVGALLILPFAAWIISKWDLGKTILVSALVQSISPVLLASSGSFGMLLFGTFYFGVTNALLDISMNAAAAVTERQLKKPIMSTCHGMWSAGAMLGAGTASVFLWQLVDPIIHLVSVSVVAWILFLLVRKRILRYKEDKAIENMVFILPNRTLLGLAFIAFAILLSEGAIADWSALYMKESLSSPAILVGISYASYSLFMAFGRFMGDAIIPFFGKKRIVVFGGLLSGVGLLFTLVLGNPYFALMGFGLTGLGFSCIVPVLFSSAANEPGYTSGAGISAVSSFGYMGFMAGPPLIGVVSEMYSLSVGLSIVVILSLITSLLGSIIRFR